MAELAIELLVFAPVFLLWMIVVSLLVRPFGIRLPFTPFRLASMRSAMQALDFEQYVLVAGTLYFGGFSLIFTMLSGYLEWRYWQGPPLTSGHIVREVVGGLFTGVVFGVFSWFVSRGNRAE